MTYKFYDTCSLLLKADHLWEDESKMVISSITLEELENIKTSSNKDADVKFAARKVVKELDDHYGAYEIVNWRQNWTPEIEANSMVVNNDSKIILCANYFANNHMIDYPKDEIFFVTNDLCCKHLARNFLNIPVESYEEEEYDYDGFADVTLSDEEMTKFYSH